MDTSGLPSLLREAARSAAVADGVLPPPATNKSSDLDKPDDNLVDTKRNNNESQEIDESVLKEEDASPLQQSAAQDLPSDQAAGADPEKSGIVKEENLADNADATTDQSAFQTNPALDESQAKPNDISNNQESSSDTKISSAPLRRGKWTMEEEQYANRLIHEFKAGLLPLTDGTTLRTFLSRLLNCDPMRISKKFVGSNCIGKQVFRRRSADVHKLTPEEIERTRLELCELERLFLERLSQSSGGKGGGGGGGRGGSGGGSGIVSTSKNSRIASRLPSLGDGGGGVSNTNKSAAALGRAMLQGKSGEGGGLLAQMQSQNQNMFPMNPAMSFLSLASQAGSLGNINTNTSLTNLMLQSGMTRDQISMLAATGLTSSASLANLLRKQRSFDQHLNMDFQSMQSFEDLASMIQGGMPNQANLPKAQMKNMDWGSQSIGATGMGNVVNPGLMSYASRQPTANAAAFPSGLMNMNNQMENAAYGNLIQNATTLQGRNFAGGQTGGATMNDFNSYIQSLASQTNQQQQNQAINYGSLLQGIGGSLQNNSQDGHKNNSLLNLLNQSAASISNTAQAQSFRPFNQNLQNDSFTGVSQGNPMIMALAQQQLLAQAGGYGQLNAFPGQARDMNNSLGQFGSALGKNWDAESSYGASSDASQLAFFQQLIAQQSIGRSGGEGSVEGLPQTGNSNLNTLSGNKRKSDDEGGATKKQQISPML